MQRKAKMSAELEIQSVRIRAPDEFDFQPTSWDNWKRRFDRYLKLSGNQNLDAVCKIDLLLHTMGGQAEKLVKQLKVSENKEYDEVLQAIDQYYKQKRNIIYERFKFNSRVQGDTERIDDFIQDLQVLIDVCEYGVLRDELLRDRIIVGLKDKKLSERFLLIPDLTLKETIRMLEKEHDENKHTLNNDNVLNENNEKSQKNYGQATTYPKVQLLKKRIFSNRYSYSNGNFSPHFKHGRKVNQTENTGKEVQLEFEDFKEILNQMNENNFKEMQNKIKSLRVNTRNQLEELVDIVYEKAVSSSESACICAELCSYLCSLYVQGDSPTNKVNFRTLIISKCQNEFTCQDNDGDDTPISPEQEVAECIDPIRKKELKSLPQQYQNRKIGNIYFIGELYKTKRMLTSKIIIFCMNFLIDKNKEDNLNKLCILITSVGKQLDADASDQLDVIFKKIQYIVADECNEIDDRVRELLKGVILLRERKWIQ